MDSRAKNIFYWFNDEGDPVPLTTEEFLELSAKNPFRDKRRFIGNTKVGDYTVSTVFLIINHAFNGGIPVLYETMIFDKEDKPVDFGEMTDLQHFSIEVLGQIRRYATKTGAIDGHKEAVAFVKRLVEEEKF